LAVKGSTTATSLNYRRPGGLKQGSTPCDRFRLPSPGVAGVGSRGFSIDTKEREFPMFKIFARKVRSFVGDFATMMVASVAHMLVLSVPFGLLAIAVLSVLLGESPIPVALSYVESLWEQRFVLLSLCAGLSATVSLGFATLLATWVVK